MPKVLKRRRPGKLSHDREGCGAGGYSRRGGGAPAVGFPFRPGRGPA
jgi:hypothetical protein